MPDFPEIAPIPVEPQNFAHTKLYRSLKDKFQQKRIPRELFKQTIWQLKRAYRHDSRNVDWSKSRLSSCMHWGSTIQGHDFWSDLDRAIETFPNRQD